MGRERNKNPLMTAAQLKKFRVDHFRLSQAKMAAELGINVRTYINYEVGDMTIPDPIAKLIRCLRDKQ